MTILMKQTHKFWEYGTGRMIVAAFCAHSVSISIGICQGYSAILIPQLMSSAEFSITTTESSWLASLGAISNPIGSVLSGILAEYLGRKISIQISSIPFLLGWICIGLSKDITLLYIGRFVTGIAAGMSAACYTYVSEISTPEQRGILQALGPICASFGILFTYILGSLIRWSTVASISLVFSLFTIVSMHFLPESPDYLLKNDRMRETYNTLFWFRRNHIVAQQEIEIYNQKKRETEKIDGLQNIYLSSQTIKPFIILIILFLLQELSGIYTILFYAVNFFQETDLQVDEYLSCIIVGVIRFVMSILAAALVNKFGRKILCVCSSFGMSLTMLVLAIYFKYYEIFSDEEKIMPYLPLFCVLSNVLFSMVGMLPIPWILVGELFPLEVRPIMAGIVICTAQCFIFICVKIYNDMLLILNFSGTLMVFFSASVLALFFCRFFLPETKGKSLSEIESFFKGEVKKSLHGYENGAFVLTPEDLSCKRSSIYSIQIKS